MNKSITLLKSGNYEKDGKNVFGATAQVLVTNGFIGTGILEEEKDFHAWLGLEFPNDVKEVLVSVFEEIERQAISPHVLIQRGISFIVFKVFLKKEYFKKIFPENSDLEVTKEFILWLSFGIEVNAKRPETEDFFNLFAIDRHFFIIFFEDLDQMPQGKEEKRRTGKGTALFKFKKDSLRGF